MDSEVMRANGVTARGSREVRLFARMRTALVHVAHALRKNAQARCASAMATFAGVFELLAISMHRLLASILHTESPGGTMHLVQRLPWITLAIGLALGGCVTENLSEATGATTGSGAGGSILARGTITDVEFDIQWEGERFKLEGEGGTPVHLVMQQVDFSVGGYTGWHTHSGPAIVMITAGELTLYGSDHPCEGRVFRAGEAFIDGPGLGNHLAKNLGSVPAQVKVTNMLPSATSPLRVDAPEPPGASECP